MEDISGVQGWIGSLIFLPVSVIAIYAIWYASVAVRNPHFFLERFPLESHFSGSQKRRQSLLKEINFLAINMGFIIIWWQILQLTILFVPSSVFIPSSNPDPDVAAPLRGLLLIAPAMFVGSSMPAYLERIALGLTCNKDI